MTAHRTADLSNKHSCTIVVDAIIILKLKAVHAKCARHSRSQIIMSFFFKTLVVLEIEPVFLLLLRLFLVR
jgi:hypothetical protein